MGSCGIDKTSQIRIGKGGKDVATPIYTAYALDMEYLTPLYKTLKERIETFEEEVIDFHKSNLFFIRISTSREI